MYFLSKFSYKTYKDDCKTLDLDIYSTVYEMQFHGEKNIPLRVREWATELYQSCYLMDQAGTNVMKPPFLEAFKQRLETSSEMF